MHEAMRHLPAHAALAPGERRVLAALARRFIPQGGVPSPTADEAAVAARAEAYLAQADPRTRAAFRGALLALEFVPLPLSRGLRRFTLLGPEEQDRALEDWTESGWYARRAVLRWLRTVIAMLYAADPRVAQELGFEPGCPARGSGRSAT